ncbi:MAG: 4a-hydroxytetrahydrobiopterin dehydratase [Chromatiales bacterium]|nr:4a-hydroxytetrahydrobiopterin dehydratase [Chromatiales bacterium]
MNALRERHCRRYSKSEAPLTPQAVSARMREIDPGWQLESEPAAIERTFRFADFHRTMAFVNAVAWIAHAEDHHPDMHVGYNRLRIVYRTHSVGGLTDNDFICAAKIDALQPTADQ